MKRIFPSLLRAVLIAAFLFPAAALAAQTAEGAGSREVFAPFISRLEVMPRGEEVALTWQDSPDLEGGYQVLRSTEPVTSSNFRQARVAGRVTSGEEGFVDRPGIPGEYYYAVAAEMATGAVYPIFISFRNATANPVTVEPGPPPEERAVSISDIEAAVDEETVSLSYSTSKEGRNVVIYRSTKPLDSLELLTEATRLATLQSTEESFTDYPVPGVDYYYGVFDSELVALGLLEFVAGENVTEEPVSLPLGIAKPTAPEVRRRTMRRRPLPLLSLDREIETGRLIGAQRQPPLPAPQELSPETHAALGPLRGNVSLDESEEPRLVVLPEERIAVDKGPEFTLATIVEGTLARGSWSEGEELLTNLLSLPLDEELTARVHFYLGQSHFFQNQYRMAFMEFLLARDHYFAPTEPWLDTTLERLDQ